MPYAIDAFHDTMKRAVAQIDAAQKILDVYNKNEGTKSYTLNSLPEASDSARFGVVLCVAAMDDFFTRKYAEVLVPVLKKNGITKHSAEMLEKAGVDVLVALQLLSMDRPYRRIRKIAQDYYKNYTTQNNSKIDGLYTTIGISKLCEHAERRTKKKNVVSSINKLVERRHKVVHSGDITRNGKLQQVNLPEIRKRISHVSLFVTKANEHIDSFMKQ